MKKFELQKPISQLFNALKSQYFACELFSDEQSNKTHKLFQKNHFCEVITLELYCPPSYPGPRGFLSP